MTGHGEKLARKREMAIRALLAEPTIEAAAKAIGVSDVTLWRWLQQPDFRAQYRAARRQVVEHAISQLQKTTNDAVAVLRRNLDCGVPSVEVRAACVVLEQAIKAIELVDLEERVRAIEALLEAQPGLRHVG